MRIVIKDKKTKSIIERVFIPENQNPMEAIQNWCNNCGYRYFDIEWEIA